MSHRLREDAFNTVGQVMARLRVVPSCQLCDARPAQAQGTADDDLELLLAEEVDSVSPLLWEKGREERSAVVVVAVEQPVVFSDPCLDDGRVALQA